MHGAFPHLRPRRLRATAGLRDLVREHRLSAHDFIAPLFVMEGQNQAAPIPSMPGVFRYTTDRLVAYAKELAGAGIPAVLLFAKVPDDRKDNAGTEALNPDGLMQRAIKALKDALPDLVVMTDVALDPYSSYGHDGLVHEGRIVNDPTCQVLAQMAVSHAQAGADVVAPSDMMDGRVHHIRAALEAQQLDRVAILSYTAKYASAFYGPFRDALDSAPGFGDKKTYQMDPANGREALLEAEQDAQEGADILMVKPGTVYLDVLHRLSQTVVQPLAVYHISGEYAMLKAAAAQGWLDYEACLLETLLAFKRAGASMIATYAALDAVRALAK